MQVKPKLLVVEDDEDSRETIKFMLESLGYEVVAFASGPKTLEQVDTLNFDLALLDIMMPNMNGYELMAELKKIEKFASKPYIFVTAKDADSEVLEGYQEGADYYITKPFTSKQLDYGIKLFIGPKEVK
jgi:CheY-like chemotaxis protein